MKLFPAAVALAATVFASSILAADIGVSVSVGQPGFYGRLDIGNFPKPQVIYAQPMVIQSGPVERPPIYLRVPPGHTKHWSKHCREYNACGEQVYFVQDNWYHREYVPRYQGQHRDQQEERRDERGDERGDDHRQNDRNDHQRGDSNRGHGHQDHER